MAFALENLVWILAARRTPEAAARLLATSSRLGASISLPAVPMLYLLIALLSCAASLLTLVLLRGQGPQSGAIAYTVRAAVSFPAIVLAISHAAGRS